MNSSLANGRPYILEATGVETMPVHREIAAATFAVTSGDVVLEITGITQKQLKQLNSLWLLADDGTEASEVRQVTDTNYDSDADKYYVTIDSPFTVADGTYDLNYVDQVDAQYTNTVNAGTSVVYVDGVDVIAAGKSWAANPSEPFRPLVLFSDDAYYLSNGTFFFESVGGGSGGGVETVTEIDGTVEVDNTDPLNPKVGLPYKIYHALLSQAGTAAPTAVILENTLGEVPTFSYSSQGVYLLTTVSPVFVVDKTSPLSGSGVSGNQVGADRYDDNTIQIWSFGETYTLDNEILVKTPLIIYIYP